MSRLKEILDIVSATEDSDDVLLELLKPEAMTREEAHEVYESCLGYDPMTYFDKRDIENYVDQIIACENITEIARKIVADNRNDIIEKAVEKATENHQFVLKCELFDVIDKYLLDNRDDTNKREISLALADLDYYMYHDFDEVNDEY